MEPEVFSILPDAAADPALVAAHAEALGFASCWVRDHRIPPVHYTTPQPGIAAPAVTGTAQNEGSSG